MEEEISVDMDAVWRTAEAPNWLTTLGIATCVAVAVMDDAGTRAWLIHSAAFAHDDEPLKDMLHDASNNHKCGIGLTVTVLGAQLIQDCEEQLEDTRTAVESCVAAMVPSAKTEYRWGEGGNIEVIADEEGWSLRSIDFGSGNRL